MEVLVKSDASGAEAEHAEGQDFLFTWKPEIWPYENLRRLVEEFRSTGTTQERWRCAAHRKIHPGDRAYLLKQGKPIGIFGRGTIVQRPEKVPEALPGERAWHVLIRFDASRGDVLWDPKSKFLVDENHVLDLPVPKKQWQNQSSGITLDAIAARGIDSIIFDSIFIGRGQSNPVDETVQEVARLKKLIEQGIRPDQQCFSKEIRENYRSKCAVTRCVTPAALEAAHISTQKGSDDNSPANGILLRSDIHALFDRLLITLSEDGTRIEVSPEVTDPGYATLKAAAVARPDEGLPPSAKNIREHRKRFFERLRRGAGNLDK
jgi:HNH endonuclease